MRSILVSGVTGFVGSSLAAVLLEQGDIVYALSRSDSTGERTRRAVKNAVNGLELDQSKVDFSRLIIIDIDYDDLSALASSLSRISCDEVWHVAAEMSYSHKKFTNAFEQNLTVTNDLYQMIQQHCLSCKRFYYVSTAYSLGFGGDTVEESVHPRPKFANVYQASKWAAEMSLKEQARNNDLAVTIFRPSIIIGDDRTGWVSNRFGMYGFIEAMLYAKKKGETNLFFDMNPDAENNMIPINRLLDYAIKLSTRQNTSEKFEVFNAVSEQNIKFSKWLEVTNSFTGVTSQSGQVQSNMDRLVEQAIGDNRLIASETWNFKTDKLRQALGSDFTPVHMTEEVYRTIVGKYVVSRLAKSHKKASSSIVNIRKKMKVIPILTKQLGISVEFVEPTIYPIQSIKTSVTSAYIKVKQNISKSVSRK